MRIVQNFPICGQHVILIQMCRGDDEAAGRIPVERARQCIGTGVMAQAARTGENAQF